MRKTRWDLLCLMIIALGFGCSPAGRDDSADNYKKGAALYKHGRYQEAIESFEQAIRLNPDFAVAYNDLGAAYLNLGRHQEAIEAYNQAISIKPDYIEPHYNLGVAYAGLGHWQEAIEAFKQAIRIKPDYVDAHNNLGIAYSNLGRWQEAIEAFKQAIRIKSNFAESHYNLGWAYLNLGRYQEAIESYKWALRIKPNFAEAHNNLGMAYLNLGRYQEAIESCKRALRIKPNFVESYYNLGMAYAGLGRWQEAIEAYNQSIGIKPDYVEAHYALSAVYVRLGRHQEAIEAYNQATSINPDYVDTHSVQTNDQKSLSMVPKLDLLSFRVDEGDSYITFVGEVKNISNENLDISAIATLYDKEGQIIKFDESFLLYHPIGPEQISPFSIRSSRVPNMKTYAITFKKFLGGIILYQDSTGQAKGKQAVTLEANSAGVSTSSGEPVKFDGALMENNQLKVFIFQGGKMSSIKAGDYVCGGEVIQAYSPGEPDGIAPDQNVVQLDYRIKVRFPNGEKVFKNGDVICGGTENISQQAPDSAAETKVSDKDAPGMDQVRNAQESFRKAQEAEQQGLYKRASFFYKRAVEYAQWALAYVIEGKRDDVKVIIREGEQKRKDLSGKEDMDASAAESIAGRDTDARPAGAPVLGLDTPREIMSWMHENIKYKTEKKGFGDRSDRWQTPEETIAAGGGDCEDNAFLAQALLKGIGIDSYVIAVRLGFTDIQGHAICIFPRKNPKDYFDNDRLVTSNNNIMKTLFRTYPKWQKIYILDFNTHTDNLILERKLWTYERMGGGKNELLIKDFLGEEG